jgi:hypothetical protein
MTTQSPVAAAVRLVAVAVERLPEGVAEVGEAVVQAALVLVRM